MSAADSPAGTLRYAGRPATTSGEPTNLADLLERILDKGIVIAGDISISLVDIELLTIKLRLLISSVDKAKEMGIDWWQSDPWLSSRAAEQQREADGRLDGDHGDGGRSLGPGRDELAERLDRLERAIGRLLPEAGAPDDDGGAASEDR